ncbi:MAG: zinc-ribbon domain-containing protein [Gemmatimonadota bacterium]
MSVLIPAVILAIAVVFFVLYPVVVGEWAPMNRDVDELTETQHRKRIALLALRDVEYDFHAGKLDESDYLRLKREISSEALQALDSEEAEWVAQAGAREAGGAQPSGEAAAPMGSENVEAEIAALRASIREGMVCPHCGHPNSRGSRFCGDCGSALPQVRSSAGGA